MFPSRGQLKYQKTQTYPTKVCFTSLLTIFQSRFECFRHLNAVMQATQKILGCIGISLQHAVQRGQMSKLQIQAQVDLYTITRLQTHLTPCAKC